MSNSHLVPALYGCMDKPNSQLNFGLNVDGTPIYFQLTHKVEGEEHRITLEATCGKWSSVLKSRRW